MSKIYPSRKPGFPPNSYSEQALLRQAMIAMGTDCFSVAFYKVNGDLRHMVGYLVESDEPIDYTNRIVRVVDVNLASNLLQTQIRPSYGAIEEAKKQAHRSIRLDRIFSLHAGNFIWQRDV